MPKARGIPDPQPNITSLYETITALKEVVEVLAGQRGSGVKYDRAATMQDLVDMDLILADQIIIR